MDYQSHISVSGVLKKNARRKSEAGVVYLKYSNSYPPEKCTDYLKTWKISESGIKSQISAEGANCFLVTATTCLRCVDRHYNRCKFV